MLLHAPKNGFFYVIDRTDGKLISAEPFSNVTWAKYIDSETGRPVKIPAARYPNGTVYLVCPDSFGAHGVEAMAYNPDAGLVYLPARDKCSYHTDPSNIEDWESTGENFLNPGIGSPPPGKQPPPVLVGWLPGTRSNSRRSGGWT